MPATPNKRCMRLSCLRQVHQSKMEKDTKAFFSNKWCFDVYYYFRRHGFFLLNLCIYHILRSWRDNKRISSLSNICRLSVFQRLSYRVVQAGLRPFPRGESSESYTRQGGGRAGGYGQPLDYDASVCLFSCEVALVIETFQCTASVTALI